MKLQRKSIVAILLLMLAFNLTATALLVQADVGGTGKFLTIEIEPTGGGYVTATKVKSGETWDFVYADPPMTEKVGAGTVELEAFAYEGWEFSHWGVDLTGSENPTDYKTVKYGYVVAVFEALTHTIYASADTEGWIEPAGAQIVNHGDTIEFTFAPWDSEEDHVSTILVDGVPEGGFLDTYTFEHVTKDYTIHVCLDPIGTVSVPEGPGGGHNVDEFVRATVVGYVDAGGVILGYSVIDEVVVGMAIRLYVMGMDPENPPTITGEGVVYAFLVPDGINPYELTIIKGDTIEAVCSDVNNDAQVDGTDVSIVANAIKFKEYYPWLDLNGDEELTQEDILVVNENKGAILEDVTGEVFWDPSGRCFITTLPMMEDDPFWRIS